MCQRRPIWINFLALCLSLSCFFTQSHAEEEHSTGTILKAKNLFPNLITEFAAEHAYTPLQLSWGLMQQKELPENHGMTFNFPNAKKRNFWMFNCFIDLSLAYCDKNKIITEIHQLKAYPDKMDPNYPILTIEDWWQNPPSQELKDFFLDNGAPSGTPVHYALEMESGWFEKNKIKVGDRCLWSSYATEGYVSKVIALDPLIKKYALPISLVFPETLHYVFSLDYEYPVRVQLLDENDRIIKKTTIYPNIDYLTPLTIKTLIVSEIIEK
ncbi:hypothetical protein SCG7109_AJ_00100 [Chlamydiales bacterium SCGC AG-110-M15]|nr:hypothetical protein SCG7109_AJ_00100 [Chlamydiales bacterium SCGC AG-110-M15]